MTYGVQNTNGKVEYHGQFELDLQNYVKASGHIELCKDDGVIALNVSGEDHKVTYQFKQKDTKGEFIGTVQSPLIGEDEYKLTIK